ncbi:MAG TPA: COX15/CtaA family protein [Trueperaceae bacterium]|nr:COX15/CtaA family protein [Trueperaceae bacterium]
MTLSLNVVVILQGAFVRISGSGAGCGSHWPTCNGTVVPLDPSLETAIEFSHRLLSFAVLLLGVWLMRTAFRTRAERPGFFAFATASLVFVVIEALIGGATVLLGLTGDNTSIARGVWVASHLVNSLLLVGALSATVVYASRRPPAYPLLLARQGGVSTVLMVALLAALVLCFTGGIAAMGNTIFPSESLAEGIRADFDPESHLLIRLRFLHPLIAITVGVYLFVALGLGWYLKPVPEARRIAQVLLGVYLAQLVVGSFNLAFLAPMALQFLHLLLAVAAFALLASLAVTQLGGTAVSTSRSPTDGATLENA